MAPASSSPRRGPTGRRRGRPPGSTNAARAARAAAAAAAEAAATTSCEPPPKRRRYIPGGSGGGGRFVDADDDTPEPARPAAASRARGVARQAPNAPSPSLSARRDRGTRTRAAAAADEDASETMRWGSAAAMAASVKQAEDYKPREERGWEEFHPNLDIEQAFLIFAAHQVDGIAPEQVPPIQGMSSAATASTAATAAAADMVASAASTTAGAATSGISVQDRSMTPSRSINPASTGNTPNRQIKPPEGESLELAAGGTPSRRPRRLTRDVVSFYNIRPADSIATPKTPKILPIQNQTSKERLDLKQPSYRKTNRIELFESKTFGQARYVDKAMSNVGYQESDNFIRPERTLIKATDANIDDDPDQFSAANSEEYAHLSRIGRVEYDMDEQDDMWLEQYNAQRKQNDLEAITREVFEITMTKIEKEWHALEKRIPKPTPKPPQTHRPRSSSAVAVNGEPHGGEEPDSKCAVCDDGDCENTNAIVFCDGCNLAVHQECYGVPFIPEGQWLCRKCQLCGRGVPTCIFCPNTDGAFKQTNSSKWAHLLCAMWIPEVSLGNHTFMEPVIEVEKVPKTRWKLTCYICRQKMGACIQCGNKNCYQAFHVTCARRARLFLKMKTSHGTLTFLDGGMVLKAFCDKHCPPDYAEENDVGQATRVAKKFYKKNMRGRIWADNQAMANVIAAQHRTAITEHPPDESQMTGAKVSALMGGEKKKGQPPKNLWKLPSGAPIIPQAVFEIVEASIQRFSFRKRKDFLSEACRYWTLKREARRGAALLKRLQLQMESFSSMELTRRNFSAMGPSGKTRLARRIEFAESMIRELGQLKSLSEEIVQREHIKLEAAELEQDFVDECYFPTARTLVQAIDKAISLDRNLFTRGLTGLHADVEKRAYVNALAFAQALGDMINRGIMTAPEWPALTNHPFDMPDANASKPAFLDIRERRKLGKRILKAIQPFLETALRVESEISAKPFESLQKELETIINASIDIKRGAPYDLIRDGPDDAVEDTIMVDAPASTETIARSTSRGRRQASDPEQEATGMDIELEDEGGASASVSVDKGHKAGASAKGSGTIATSEQCCSPGTGDEETTDVATAKHALPKTVVTSETPPPSTGYSSVPRASQEGPPTPPQSNGSLGKEPLDPLAEGGILWYLNHFCPLGTSVCDDHSAPSRDAVRMLSEDLTDLDDEEFKGLGIDVDNMDDGVGAAVAMSEPGETDGGVGASAGRGGGRPKRRRASARKR